MTLTRTRQRILWRLVDNALVCDETGKIIHNAFQQDDPVILEKYNDGVIVLRSCKTGRLLVPPYRIDRETGKDVVVDDWEEP